jgi:hypothetical protein
VAAARNQEFTLPGVSRPSMRLRIETFECHAEGMYSGNTIKPQFWWATLDGPKVIAVEEALVEVIRYRIGLPPDALPDDPELRIRWTLRRTDTNDILSSPDTQAQAGLTFSFDATAALRSTARSISPGLMASPAVAARSNAMISKGSRKKCSTRETLKNQLFNPSPRRGGDASKSRTNCGNLAGEEYRL